MHVRMRRALMLMSTRAQQSRSSSKVSAGLWKKRCKCGCLLKCHSECLSGQHCGMQ